MESVLITFSKSDFQDLIAETVTACLKRVNSSKESTTIVDTWFNLDALRSYLPNKPAAATVYAWVSKNEIPYHKKGKKLSFLKFEIDQWLKSGKQLSNSEIIDAADQALKIKQHA